MRASPRVPSWRRPAADSLARAEFVIPFILLSDLSHLPISVGILNFQGTFAINATGILAAGALKG